MDRDHARTVEGDVAARHGNAGSATCGYVQDLASLQLHHSLSAGTTQRLPRLYRHHGPRRITPFFVPASIINMVAGHVSMRFGFKGPNLAVVTACTTGLHCIGEAGRMIEYGDADVVIAGGAEATVSPLGIGGFAAMRALSTRNDDPATASRPWDKDRDGFVLGEGAGMLLLEELEHAKSRGARIYGEILGYGSTADAYRITDIHPEGRGAVACIRMALQDAERNPEEIGYVNAHGTSTPLGDAAEVSAVKELFGNHAKKLAMSSTKSVTGHALGAAERPKIPAVGCSGHFGVFGREKNIRTFWIFGGSKVRIRT